MQINVGTGEELTMNMMIEKTTLGSEDEWNIIEKCIVKAVKFRGREKKMADDTTMDRINISIVLESFFVFRRDELQDRENE